ncbi:MAG: hypothetical protein P8R42_00605 [Candidatus Binatia bacterium]|nr:hypothetical protein [Candidatus Binatia bacterium]
MKAPAASPTLADLVSEAEDIRDIRGLVNIPSPWEFLIWVALALAVLAAVALLVRWLRRPAAAPLAPSADSVAFAALERARAWMTPEQAERFGTAVSSAVRQYVEARFDVSARRRTTEEFLRSLTKEPAAELSAFVPSLEEFLRQMDLVKFARQPLDETQMEGLLETARDFVSHTRRDPGTEKQP